LEADRTGKESSKKKRMLSWKKFFVFTAISFRWLFQMSQLNFLYKAKNIDGFSKKNKWTKVNWVLLKTKIYDIDTLEFKTDGKSATSFVQNVI
jgi:hypothetical protein